jgi:DNA-directed RNA polymerase subunit RPC12/RpoP
MTTETIPDGQKIIILRYRCPFCKKELVTKKEEPKQCSYCRSKFLYTKPEIIRKVRI